MGIRERLADWLTGPTANGHAVATRPELAVDGRKGINLVNVSGGNILQPGGGRPMGPMGGFGSDVSEVNRQTAYAAAAYCYVAIRYRMRKFSEPSLMVVEEDPTSGAETYLPDHPLAELLANPSPDFDMGRLLARTKAYLDVTGQAVWVKDLGRAGNVGALMPFHGDEFTVEQRDGRMHGLFRLDSDLVARDRRTRLPEEVVFFQELDPFAWNTGTSRVDVALSWLNLSAQALASTRDVLRNALFPSVIVQADPKWNPDPDEWEKFKQALAKYGDRENRGGPLALLGGGSATKVSLSLKDLVPSEVLARVESVVAAVFGIPAVVLQYQIGIENAPWSQMAEARRMAYEDTIEPEWREFETAITRQLLWAPPAPGRRPTEENHSRFLRFDTSKIRALQSDIAEMTTVAQGQSEIASLNERRKLVGLDPSDDPRADEIPELRALDTANSQPEVPPTGFENPFAQDAGTGNSQPNAQTDQGAPGSDQGAGGTGDQNLPSAADEAAAAAQAAQASARLERLETKGQRSLRKDRVWHSFDLGTKLATDQWENPIADELAVQRDTIAGIAEHVIGKAARGPIEVKADSLDPKLVAQFKRAVDEWLNTRGQARMRAIAYPLVMSTASSAVHAVAGDLGLTFQLLQPGLTDYAVQETVFLAGVMGKTTGEAVAAEVQASIEAGDTISKLVKRLRDLPAFDRTRARLTARTETTRAWNGAQFRQVDAFAQRTGQKAMKSWLTAGDDRVRPEHEDNEADGWIPLDETFSNGLDAPGEPNCRCTLLYEFR